jgi:hypothetical protein
LENISVEIEIEDKFSEPFKKFVKAYETVTKKVFDLNADMSYDQTALIYKLLEEEEKAEKKKIKEAEKAEREKIRAEKKAFNESKREHDKAEREKVKSEKKAATELKKEKDKKLKQEKKDAETTSKFWNRVTFGLSGFLKKKFADEKGYTPSSIAIGMWTALGQKVVDFTSNILSSIVSTIDLNTKLTATLGLFGRTGSEAKNAASEVRAFSAKLGVSMEQASKWRLDMEEMNMPEQMRQMTMDAMADIETMGGNANSIMGMLHNMRDMQLQGRKTVQATQVIEPLKGAGIDQTRLERALVAIGALKVDLKNRAEVNRAMGRLAINTEDMPRLIGLAVADKTGKALGGFAEDVTARSIAGNWNKLKIGVIEVLEKVNWDPLIKMAQAFIGWALSKETIENFSKGITALVAELPAFAEQIHRFVYWLSHFGGGPTPATDSITVQKNLSMSTSAGSGTSPKSLWGAAKYMFTGETTTAKANWRGGEVTGITNGLATVKAAPSEGLVSIGKGELIVPRDGRSQDGSKSLVINFNGPISASGNVGEIQAMFETALTRALQSMEVQL